MGEWYSKLSPSDTIFNINKKEEKLDVDSVTSHLLQKYFKDGYNHPAKDFPHLFSKEFPDAVLTYEWSKAMGDNNGLLAVLKDPRVQQASSSDDERSGSRLLVWIAVFFIDQMSKKVTEELAISQAYYILCKNHIVAGSSSVLDRGWCLWELGLRAYKKKTSLIIGELSSKDAGYDFLGNKKLFDPADEVEINVALLSIFGFEEEGKNKMNQTIAAQVGLASISAGSVDAAVDGTSTRSTAKKVALDEKSCKCCVIM